MPARRALTEPRGAKYPTSVGTVFRGGSAGVRVKPALVAKREGSHSRPTAKFSIRLRVCLQNCPFGSVINARPEGSIVVLFQTGGEEDRSAEPSLDRDQLRDAHSAEIGVRCVEARTTTLGVMSSVFGLTLIFLFASASARSPAHFPMLSLA